MIDPSGLGQRLRRVRGEGELARGQEELVVLAQPSVRSDRATGGLTHCRKFQDKLRRTPTVSTSIVVCARSSGNDTAGA